MIGTFENNELVNEEILIEADGDQTEFVIKPSWSKTGDKIVFQHAPDAAYQDFVNFVFLSCGMAVINSDGTGLKLLTSGTDGQDPPVEILEDFRPSWMRDGSNTIFAQRFKDDDISYHKGVLMDVNANFDEFETLNGVGGPTSSLEDGTLIFNIVDNQSLGYIDAEGNSGTITVESTDFAFPADVSYILLVNVSPDETKIAFVVDFTFYNGTLNGIPIEGDGEVAGSADHMIFVADFDAKEFVVKNLKVVGQLGDSYPSWSPDNSKIVYNQQQGEDWFDSKAYGLALYDVATKEHTLIRAEAGHYYGYPCFKNSPH